MKIESCKIKNSKAKLLIHTCCAPCLTSVAEKVKDDFQAVVFWYNPNIEPKAEHDKRLETLKKYLGEIKLDLADCIYDYETENAKWHNVVAELENEPEGGRRCQKCIEFRLQELKKFFDQHEFALGSTTLTVSPHKNSKQIIEIGAKILGDKFLAEDFKKRNGYLRSIELSKEHNLYRQNYCGCLFSKK